MWLLLLMPTWIMAQGWTDVLQPYGVAQAMGINLSWLYGEFFGPLGIIVVLTSTALPFAFFIVSAGLRGLGPEFEDAARIHGAGRWRTMKTVLPIIAPAILGALAISFAETISDFGVADTLGYHAHFPLATYTLFSAISNFPANFSVAAVIAAFLILATVPCIALQSIVESKAQRPTRSWLGEREHPGAASFAGGRRTIITAWSVSAFSSPSGSRSSGRWSGRSCRTSAKWGQRTCTSRCPTSPRSFIPPSRMTDSVLP